jgi:hypothetical protein
MALTLAAGISASDRYCTVNQPPTQPPGSYYRIGDEVVQHIGFATPTPIWSQTSSSSTSLEASSARLWRRTSVGWR